MESPLVSIIVPIYNAAMDMVPCLESIKHQRYQNLEVLLVNDGSSDNTWAIISELHEKEPEMFSGVNLSRNRGHQNALLAGLLTAVNDAAAKIVSGELKVTNVMSY